MLARGIPADIMVSIIGRRNSAFGTGRVMSQMRMQALLRPLASSESDCDPIGCSRACTIEAWVSGSFGRGFFRMIVGIAFAGNSSGR
jgi:hypothetical protein